MTEISTSAVVWIVDRLGARFLGPYGNAGVDTPHANRLAAESLVAEQAQIDSPDLATIYRSYWEGTHAVLRAPNVSAISLPQMLNDAKVQTVLVSDDRAVLELPLASDFTRRELIQLPVAQHLAEEMDDTHLARFNAAVLDILDELTDPYLLWVHSRGLNSPWDAPLELRESMGTEDDPPPPKFVEVPSRRLEKDYDPDELLGIVQAYCGQVMLWDMCLGAFLQSFTNRPFAKQSLFSLTSPRGFPLGEHLCIGDAATALYGELLHVPWFIRCGSLAGAALRTKNLVQPGDMFATLLDWFDLASQKKEVRPHFTYANSLLSIVESELNPWPRDRAVTVGDQEIAIRIENWFLKQERFDHPDGKAKVELYRKPEDLWEVNEVSDRAVQEAAQLREVLHEFIACSADADRTPTPLTPELLQ